MRKKVTLTESDLNNLIKKVIREQNQYVAPLDIRVKGKAMEYIKFLENSLRMLRPNDANEQPTSVESTLVNILKKTGDYLALIRELEKQNTQIPKR